MKRLIPITFFLVISFLSNAQFETIDLSKYKLPEIKRHRLDFSFQFNNNFRSFKVKDSPRGHDLELNNRLNANYSYLRNSANLQMNSWGRLTSNIDLNWDKSDEVAYNKDDSYYFDFDLGFFKRYYPQENKWFYSYTPGLKLSIDSDYDREPSVYDEELQNKSLIQELRIEPELQIGAGYGRVEPVGDLRHAVYILEDLFKNDRLKRLPDENEIYQFAQKISQLKNKRFFDSRLRKIYEISSLDSTLVQLGLVDKMNAAFFTSLNDMWLFGDEYRNSGSRIQIGIEGALPYRIMKEKMEEYNFNIDKLSIINKYHFYNEKVGGEISFDFYKPIGLKWQRFFGTNFSVSHFFLDKSMYNLLSDYTILQGSATYRYDWFLNTRTSASIGLFGNYSRFDYSNTGQDYTDQNTISCSFNGNINYYFSPKLKVSFNYSISYHDFKNFGDYNYTYFTLNNSLNLSYSIF